MVVCGYCSSYDVSGGGLKYMCCYFRKVCVSAIPSIYIYIYVYMQMCIFIYIYMYVCVNVCNAWASQLLMHQKSIDMSTLCQGIDKILV